VDLFEHMWVVDRLERLGISRYFQQEIKECVNYVSRYINDKLIYNLHIVERKKKNMNVRKHIYQMHCLLYDYSLDKCNLKFIDIGLRKVFAGREIQRFKI
jgi:hypothetical protein